MRIPSHVGIVARKALFIALLMAAGVSLTGCWDRREIEDIGFVVGAAIDLIPDTDEILLTVQIAKPFAIGHGSPGSSSADERPFWTVKGTGKTVLDATTKVAERSPRMLLWAHNDLVVFGEEFARQGIGDALDFLVRHRESRLSVRPLVVKEVTGSYAAFSAESELNPIPSDSISQTLEVTVILLSTAPATSVNDVYQILETDGIEVLLPAVELVPVNPDEDTFEGELKRETISYTTRLAGSAVFKQDRMVGFLSPAETRGRQWVKGNVRRAVVTVPHPQLDGQDVSLHVSTSSSKITFRQDSEVPSFDVVVDATANLGDSDAYIDPLDTETWKSLERRLAIAIESEIRSALGKAQSEFDSDIFGFGELLHRRHPDQWSRLRSDWDYIFGTMTVNIAVNARLAGPGLTFRGPRIQN